MNWMQLKLEVVKKDKDELKASGPYSVDLRLVEVANTSLGRAKAAKMLEAEVGKLKAIDRQIDRMPEFTKLRFEELGGKVKSFF